jgi:hypothetical protein
VPLLQNYVPNLTLHVRTARESHTLLAAYANVQSLDATLLVYNLPRPWQDRETARYVPNVWEARPSS